MVRVYNSGQNKSQLKVEGHARIKKEKKKKNNQSLCNQFYSFKSSYFSLQLNLEQSY